MTALAATVPLPAPPRAPRTWSLRTVAHPLLVVVVLLAGLGAYAAGADTVGQRIWWTGLLLTGLPVALRTVRGVARGQFAADLVALLAIVTALLLGLPLPGLIVVLMQTGGEMLERYAAGRASSALLALEAAAPRMAHRLEGDVPRDIAAGEVRVGDRLLVRPGEMVPVDADVTAGESHLDCAQLTGEPLPVRVGPGTRVMSGSLNQEAPLTLVATAPASGSQYARIVALVREASAGKSPLLRMADRYATWFTPLTLLVCAAAFALTGDSTRVLAVLVVATPCPLILAAPVAMLGGINRAARRNIIVRNGEALERLATATVAVFDKTGTLTIGSPAVALVTPLGGLESDRLLALAAAVEQGSGHMLARSVVDHAVATGVTVSPATGIVETPGQGVVGTVQGDEVAVGARHFLRGRYPAMADAIAAVPETGALRAWVAVNRALAGLIEYRDLLRPRAAAVVQELRSLGLARVVLLTGDQRASAEVVAQAVGITEVQAELLPEDKVNAVAALELAGDRVVMLGDGTNDAPALRRATVGVALAGHGGGITAEAADMVLLSDDPGRLAEAIRIARRTMQIARQSIWVGLGLSGIAMGCAAAGWIPPTLGAALQEGIDIGVILNALRASRDPAAPLPLQPD